MAFLDMRKATQQKAPGQGDRRSPCPVACLLDIVGDRWTLLVVRDLFLGRSRFKEFTASSEQIPTNILSERLERLLHYGIVEQVPAEDGTKRLGYRLSTKGQALLPVVKAMRDWGLKWVEGTWAQSRRALTKVGRVGATRSSKIPSRR